MGITLAQIKTQSRQRADEENSDFISDSELTSYINSSIAELHDLLIAAYASDYYLENVSITTTAGTEDYALPNGTNYSAAPAFYKLRGVDGSSDSGSTWFTVQSFNWNQRNLDLSLPSPYADVRYRVAGSNLKLSPIPQSAFTVRLWYTPVATKLVTDSDELNDLNQYAEYVIIDAAIKMAIKSENDISALAAQKQAMYARIKSMAQNRDADQAERVSDTWDSENEFWFRK